MRASPLRAPIVVYSPVSRSVTADFNMTRKKFQSVLKVYRS